MDFSAIVRTERTLLWAATILTIITVAGVICRILKIDLTYDSTSASATVVGDIAVFLVVILVAISLLLLLPRMYIAWWNNRAPSFLEKTMALVVLVTPLGLPVYYFFVFRRMDHNGQYRLF
jgi:uncharacterized membrane protein YkgB